MTEEGNGVVTHPEIEEDSCKGCGRCVAACPRKCLALKATMIETLEQIKANPKMDGQEMHIIAGIAMLGEMIDDSLTIDACRQLGIHHIVRGVRNMIDFETERSIADANRRLAPDIETIIIPTAQEFAHISSSAVRDILRHGGDYSAFIPEGIEL